MKAGLVHALWRDLPVGSLHEVAGRGACLILAPHPDDESLGCGGLIAACCAAGRPPIVVLLTDGSASHPHSRQYPPTKLAALRQAEATRAVGILGLASDRLLFLGAQDGAAPHVGVEFENIVQRLIAIMQRHDCATILTTWRGDPHCDHVAAAAIGDAVARRAGVRHISYPIWGWTLDEGTEVDVSQVRGWRLDITAHLAAKRAAIAAHASQYGGIITDDPGGFQLPATLLQATSSAWETYLLP